MSDCRGSWELTKENIQPLSSGRRMADLAGALSTRTATGLSEQLQYEENHLKEIEKLENVAKRKEGDDPLQAWVELLKYFQRHFPNMNQNVKTKYALLLRACLKEFYGDAKYINDDRYIQVVIASMKGMPMPQQIRCLSDFLKGGHGEFVSIMYVRLAELFDTEGDTKKAAEILKEGIAKVPQANKGHLEELLMYIQECWAKKYASALQNNEAASRTEEDSQSDARSFASSVPIVGENNEAVSIRQHLQPAAPTNTSKSSVSSTRQNSVPQKLGVYTEENSSSHSLVSNGNLVQTAVSRLESLNRPESDRENRLEPGRWNARHAHLENPVIPEPQEKLKLYVETDALPIKSSSTSLPGTSQTVNKRALQERKEESTLSEAETLTNFQPPATVPANPPTGPVNVSSSSNQSAVVSDPRESISESVPVRENNSKGKGSLWSKNYTPNMDKDNFFDNIKYKPLPPGRVVSYLMMKCDKYLEEREQELKLKEQENSELAKLRGQIGQLRKTIDDLSNEIEHFKTVAGSTQVLGEKLQEAQRLAEVKLFEKEERITELESENEGLMNQLTKMTTFNNVLESKFLKLQQQMDQERMHHEGEKQQYIEELQIYKRKVETLLQEQKSVIIKRVKQEKLDEEPEYKFDKGYSFGKQSFVDIDVRSRTADMLYSSPSTDQGTTGDVSKFHSGETTVEHQQSVAASSFMPDLNMDNTEAERSVAVDAAVASAPRRVFGMVERPLENDMMNMTPVAPPPMDFEIPAPSFGGGFGFKKPSRAFSLYESLSESVSTKPSRNNFSFAGNKRTDIVRNLQSLPENLPPPAPRPPPVMQPAALYSDENVQSRRTEMVSEHHFQNENQFRRPALPTDENVAPPPTLPKPRRSILLARFKSEDDSSDEEDDVILRRHQQTGIDLNVSNLTTALAMGPRPLINSTPEKEKTFRDLPNNLVRKSLVLAQQDNDESHASDSHVNRPSRYSMLNEPPLNLSTIQETSRESRSRSTTGSSSSGGNTMSATRFGMASSSAQLYGIGNMTGPRSSSIPRSEGRISHLNNNNGYYSDTNAMQ